MWRREKHFVGLLVAVSCLAACTAAGDQDSAANADLVQPPPRYFGVYVEDDSALKQITYNRYFKNTVISSQRPSFFTYGIDLNAGLLAPMDPASTVGLERESPPTDHFLEIEPIDPDRLYFRYTLREAVDLPDGDYTFFIRERFAGTKALQAHFRIAGRESVPEEQ